jgi:hypothetical protein
MWKSKWVFVAVAIMLSPVGANALIFDGAHNAGNPHFYFLPPMVRAPSLPGPFDPTLDPVVEIVELATDTVVAVFTTDGQGDGSVRIDDERSAYFVIWHTRDFNLDTGNVYRVWVSVEGLDLGFADVALVDNPWEARNLDAGEYVPLVNGHSLPIRFAIQQ